MKRTIVLIDGAPLAIVLDESIPACEVPDCEFLATTGTKCYAHRQGKNPTMTMQEYIDRNIELSKRGRHITSLGEEREG